MKGKKKTKVVASAEQAEQEIKKDLFWKALFLYGFALIYVIGVLHGKGWDTPFVVALLIGVYVFLVIVTPHWLYDKVEGIYSIFSKKIQDDKERTQEEITNAKLVYNAALFIFLSFVAYMLSGAVGYFLLDKNRVLQTILMVFLDLVALALSIKITNSRAKVKEE